MPYLRPYGGGGQISDFHSPIGPLDYEPEISHERENIQPRGYSERFGALNINMHKIKETGAQECTTTALSETRLRPKLKTLPTEIWDLIIGFVAKEIDDDSYQTLGDLRSCVLTCQVCLNPVQMLGICLLQRCL